VCLGCLALATGCAGGEDDEPERELHPETLTIGVVVRSDTELEIEQAARVAAAEVNDAGGIEGEVRLVLVAGTDPRTLAERGATVFVLPCAPVAEEAAVASLRGRRVLTLATCANTPVSSDERLTTPWGVGPDLGARAALLGEVLRERDVDRVRLDVTENAAIVGKALADEELELTPAEADAVVTDGDWGHAVSIRAAQVYGLEQLDSASAASRAGVGGEGVAFATFGYPSPGTELDELYERIRLDFGARPDGSHALLGYNAVRVAVEAVEDAGSVDPAALAEAIPGLTVAGAVGTLVYDEDGARRPAAESAVVELRDGRLELVERGRGGD
jgi:hypothetical protein